MNTQRLFKYLKRKFEEESKGKDINKVRIDTCWSQSKDFNVDLNNGLALTYLRIGSMYPNSELKRKTIEYCYTFEARRYRNDDYEPTEEEEEEHDIEHFMINFGCDCKKGSAGDHFDKLGCHHCFTKSGREFKTIDDALNKLIDDISEVRLCKGCKDYVDLQQEFEDGYCLGCMMKEAIDDHRLSKGGEQYPVCYKTDNLVKLNCNHVVCGDCKAEINPKKCPLCRVTFK